MSFLDVRTIIIGLFFTNATCTIVLALFWTQYRNRFEGIGWWLLDFMFQTTAVILVVAKGRLPDWLSMTVPNTMVIAGGLFGYIGLARFVERKPIQIQNYILLAAFALVHFHFVYVRPNLAARDLIFSLGLLVVCGQCAWLVFSHTETDLRRMARGVGLVFVLACLVSLARIIFGFIAPSPNTDFFQSSLFEAATMLAYQVLLVALAFSLIMLVNQRLLKDIRFQEEKYAVAFRSSPYAITLTRLSDGKIMDVNDGFTRISGYSYEEAVGKTSFDLRLWDREEDRTAIIGDLAHGRRILSRELRFRKKSGELTIGRMSAEIITVREQPWILSSIDNITELKQAEKSLRDSERRFRTAQDISLDAFTILQSVRDEKGRIVDFLWVYANDTAGRILKHPPEKLVGQRLLHVLPGNRENEALFRRYVHIVETGQGDEVELEYRSENISGWFRNMAVKLDDGVAISFADITERKRAEENLKQAHEKLSVQLSEIEKLHDELREQAVRDPLTGVYNRRVIKDIFQREFSRAKREGRPLSVIMLDMDHLKKINDTYGHRVGDLAIQTLAQQLQTMIRAEDVICRYAGDEFMVLLNNATSNDAFKRVEQWRQSLGSAPLATGSNGGLMIQFTAGIASYPLHGTLIEEVVSYADVALYRAKVEGRNRTNIFS